MDINPEGLLTQIRTGNIPDGLPATRNLYRFIDTRLARGESVEEFVNLSLGYLAVIETRLTALESLLDQDARLRQAIQEIFPEGL